VATALPAGAHYVKAFRTLGADSLATSANRAPRRAVLFHAVDDDRAATAMERLITVCGFDPVRIGGVTQAGRIEVAAAACTNGGLGGKLLDTGQGHAVAAA